MFKSVNRDLLVISKQAQQNAEAFEQEVASLNDMLYGVEKLQNIAIASEIVNLNRYRMLRKPKDVLRVLQQKPKAFVFLLNKN